MLESSLIYVVARTLPESIVTILSAMIMSDKKYNMEYILKKGILLGCIIASVRMLPINFGVHTVLSMISLWIVIYKFINNDLIKSMICTCEVFISLMLSEVIYIGLMTEVLKVPFPMLSNNRDIEGALVTLPSLIVLFLLVVLLKKLKNKFLQKQNQVN